MDLERKQGGRVYEISEDSESSAFFFSISNRLVVLMIVQAHILYRF